MKKYLLLFFLLLFSLSVVRAADGYDIKVHIKGFKDTVCYLGHHFGDKQYIVDTTRIDKNGWAEFKGKEALHGGIYLVALPTKTYFEILVNTNEQNFTIETDTTDFVNTMEIKNSPENKLFNKYQRFITSKGAESSIIRGRMDDKKLSKDSLKLLQQKLVETDSLVKNYRLQIIKEEPSSLLALILNTMRDPDVPDFPRDEKGNVLDSAFQYHYFKSHYWDYIDFSDERILRTPILESKIKFFNSKLTVPLPDSLIESADTIIERSKANKEVFRYCTVMLTSNYETSNIMGYDKIFVHIAEKYYLSKDAFWVDSTLRAKLTDKVEKIKPNILGTPAHNLTMPDTSLMLHSLYDVKAKFTVLAFWDPTCSHCKVEIPALSHYADSARKAGVDVEVFAVGIESDMEEWKKFIRDNKLHWTNVSDLYNNTKFRDYYDIFSTPVIYLLDEKKNIIAKRLDVEKLRGFIDNCLKTNK